MKSDSRLSMRVIVPFHPSFPSFDCTHYLPDKPVIYSDSNLLPSQEIFTFRFCAPNNDRRKIAKTAIPSTFCLFSVSSSLPQADLGTGAGISPASPLFLCLDALPLASPSPIRSSFSWTEAGIVPIRSSVCPSFLIGVTPELPLREENITGP
jgi:hypothetical protein